MTTGPYVAILAPRGVLQSVGGFRQGLWVNEDFDLWLRFFCGGLRLFLRGRAALPIPRARGEPERRLHAGG